MGTYSFKWYHKRLNTWTSFFVDIRLIDIKSALCYRKAIYLPFEELTYICCAHFSAKSLLKEIIVKYGIFNELLITGQF